MADPEGSGESDPTLDPERTRDLAEGAGEADPSLDPEPTRAPAEGSGQADPSPDSERTRAPEAAETVQGSRTRDPDLTSDPELTADPERTKDPERTLAPDLDRTVDPDSDGSSQVEPGSSSRGSDPDATALTFAPGASARPTSRGSGGSSGSLGDPDDLPEALPGRPADERYGGELDQPSPGQQLRRERRLERQVLVRRPTDELDAADLRRRTLLLAQLDHPSIPRVHDLGELDGELYAAEDPPAGRALGEVLDEGQLNLTDLLRAMRHVAGALAHAADRGLVHGALTPQSVFLGDHGQVSLTGWEQARLHAQAPAELGELLEDPSGTPADPRDDVRGLGRLLEQSLAGTRIPRPLRAVLDRAQAADRDRRYSGSRELGEELSRLLDDEAVAALPDTPLSTLGRWSRRHPQAAAVAVTAALASLASAATAAMFVSQSYSQSLELREQAAASLLKAKASVETAAAEQDKADRATQETEARVAAQLAVARLTQLTEVPDVRSRLGSLPDSEPLKEALIDRLLAKQGELELRLDDAGQANATFAALIERLKANPDRSPSLAAPARLGRYEALRRLPGQQAAQEQRVVLASMKRAGVMEDEEEELGRLANEIEAIYAYSFERFASQRTVADAQALPPLEITPRIKAIQRDLRQLVRRRGDLALSYELDAKLQIALAAKPVREFLSPYPNRSGRLRRARRRIVTAWLFGPASPDSIQLHAELCNRLDHFASVWEWRGSWTLQQYERAVRRSRSIPSLLRFAHELQRHERYPASLDVLERAESLLAELAELGDEPRDPRAAEWLGLLKARGRLVLGKLPERIPEDQPDDPFQDFLVPPQIDNTDYSLAADRLTRQNYTLLGWALLARAGPEAHFREDLEPRHPVYRGLAKLAFVDAPTAQVDKDRRLATLDRRISNRTSTYLTETIVSTIEQSIPPEYLERYTPYPNFLTTWFVLAGRAGRDLAWGEQRLAAVKAARAQRTSDPYLVYEPYFLAVDLGRGLSLVEREPEVARGHLKLLALWGGINRYNGNAVWVATEAKQALIARLRRLGHEEQAQAFERVAGAESQICPFLLPLHLFPSELDEW